jgi:hypothetical protein
MTHDGQRTRKPPQMLMTVLCVMIPVTGIVAWLAYDTRMSLKSDLSLLQSVSNRTGFRIEVIRVNGVIGLREVNVVRMPAGMTGGDLQVLVDAVNKIADVDTIDVRGSGLDLEQLRWLKTQVHSEVMVGEVDLSGLVSYDVTVIEPDGGY